MLASASRLLVVVALLAAVACGGGGGGGTAGETSTGSTDGSASAATTTTSGTTDPTTGVAPTTGTSGEASTTGAPLEGYDDPALWLCHPDKPVEADACLSADLTATELLADGGTAIVEHTIAAAPAFDCFYVYPTVDIRFQPGQTESFDDLEQELDPLLNQAARFTSMCRMFAPLYHQVTIGTYGSAELETLLTAAYQDVLAAFESYLERHADGRPLLIFGHSQGTYMTTRLLQEVVEPDPALRERLLAAILLGGSFSVPFDTQAGGTLPTIPLCESAEQLGCVVAYRTYAAELPPEPGSQAPDIAGNDVACTNPAALGGGSARARGAFFPNFTHQEAVFPKIDFGQAIDTPFVIMRDFYGLSCQADVDGEHYLAVALEPDADDVRTNPVDFTAPLFAPGFLGLHVLDYNFALQDLLDLAAAKAAAAGL
ncbi:DUF3089 domain-containing protein [Nannocystis punicea]|uniref:DUF3089 domain-containing protein n=1 Tax=Nannocystis punicea TaxID=2995304 RepID=A0ABY7GSR5_9BACT|nr:DUF3089 domain-containing protein [Nannocystis poenicansa]WAS89963.1 DUF3089 domain-containing protein [Nannocystis poenicansa]